MQNPNGVRVAMNGVEQVYHLAALIAIPFSYQSPETKVDTNIKGTLNIFGSSPSIMMDTLAAVYISVETLKKMIGQEHNQTSSQLCKPTRLT